MRLAIERLVEADDRPGAFQVIARHLKLVHGMRVEDVKPDRRPIGRFASPHVQILMSASFEEEGVVARREFG